MSLDSPSILFVNRVLPPSSGATGRCLLDLTTRLAAQGWRVTVLHDGVESGSGPGGMELVGTAAGGAVHRPLRPGTGNPADAAPDARAYLDSLRRLAVAGLKLPRHRLVVTMTDPPLLALAGPLLAARHGASAIHWSHDLYPGLLPTLGVRYPRPLLVLTGATTARALRRHDRVVAIGRCMARRIMAMGVPQDRISVLPNWPDPAIRSIPHEANLLRGQLGLNGRFVVAYSGNLGLAHPMDGVLRAAVELAATDPDILFLVGGDGRGHAAFVRAVGELGLPNLRLLPWQPTDRLAAHLSAPDLHLATMKPEAAGLMVPSKVSGALAAGRPCLFLGPADSDAAHLVADCGAVLDPADGSGLAATIRRYAADPALLARHGAAALAQAGSWDADRAAGRFSALAAGLLKPQGHLAGWRRVPDA